jgi:PIN domain nuclease of toxin-antitoxin system
MNYLLDTHTFLWAAFSPNKLSAKARNEIRSAENQVCISIVSFWEISLKYTLGKIELSNCTPADMPDIATQMGIEIIQLGAQETASFYQLPNGHSGVTTTDNDSHPARFPLPNPPPKGEGTNDLLRKFQVNVAHKDPFDRMIIWQAIQQQRTLVSKDANFPEYRQFGLKVLW